MKARRDALQLGFDAEAAVCEDLIRRGWRVAARRFVGHGAEIDVIAVNADALRFVEVKARSASDGLEAVDDVKVARLSDAADAWLDANPGDWTDIAFAIAIVAPTDGSWSITWIDDAFDGAR